MAASLRLGRQGILFGLKLSKLNKCLWATQPLQDHSRHFFLSPWSLGKCCHSSIKTTFVLVWGDSRRTMLPQSSIFPSNSGVFSNDFSTKLAFSLTSVLQGALAL